MPDARMPYRTLHFGIGAIGAQVAALALRRDDVSPVAATDADPAKRGRDLGQLCGAAACGVMVDPGALTATECDVVLHCTGSFLPDVMPQLLGCIAVGRSVISTCEELSYPWHRYPELARELDERAKAKGVRVLGTGINPGFMLDALVLAASAASQGVEAVRGLRLVDVSTRREQLQRKVGVGLTRAEFEAKLATGRFGHVGLKESAWLIAAGLGWKLDALDETLEPVMAPSGSSGLTDDPAAIGITQHARGTMGGREVIALEVTMTAAADRPRDEIILEGTPRIWMTVEPGPQGDLATASVLVNAIPGVLASPPGLLTMLDLVPLRGRGLR
ncbi:MAG: dihydrodipicolinate reductase [Dehalococcoidia bacterium]